VTSLQQPDLTPTHALPPLFEAWAAWSQDMFSIYSQMLTAQWRFANTTLGAFTPWLEPAVAMTEQMLGGPEPHHAGRATDRAADQHHPAAAPGARSQCPVNPPGVSGELWA